ncbi:type II toxin-antitoxin system antitoxin SocA domain-containing protein [Bacteroides fragilis]|uniref:type II toxin-antitoxin system antitoxin SocA domain-containing protein n=1 Tax=Bacteroides fragilis TaxID=817 RepID=UPI0032EDD36D
MKSPFTGGKVVLHQENAELVFRREKFKYIYLYYLCEDTKERFTTTEIDEINISQVYNQYRIKYGIPFPDEIKHIRQMYELSASKMSEILGFGDNQYRLYENGDIPSEANGKILSSIKEPSIFKVFVENAKNQFEAKEFEKILSKLKKVMEHEKSHIKEELIFGSYSRGACNGYATQSYTKLKNIILYFIEKCDDTFNTKMNKLLFYTDFLSYKTYGRGISGLAYKAIQFGPVPVRWDRVYSLMDDVYPEIIEFNSGNCGTKLCSTLSPDFSCFSIEEQSILDAVWEKFKDISASDISELSHKEDAWEKYNTTNLMIDYKEAFTLRAFD